MDSASGLGLFGGTLYKNMFTDKELLDLCRILNGRSKTITEHGCWINGNAEAYPKFMFKGVNKKVAVFAAVAYLGLVLDEDYHIPKGIEVCHKCLSKNCWNPDHLYIGSHSSNRKDVQYDRIIKCLENEHEIKRHGSGSLYCNTCAIDTEMRRRLKLRKYLKLA